MRRSYGRREHDGALSTSGVSPGDLVFVLGAERGRRRTDEHTGVVWIEVAKTHSCQMDQGFIDRHIAVVELDGAPDGGVVRQAGGGDQRDIFA